MEVIIAFSGMFAGLVMGFIVGRDWVLADEAIKVARAIRARDNKVAPDAVYRAQREGRILSHMGEDVEGTFESRRRD